jgi:predicted Zn-dependent protease with MMP-like domain
MDEAVPGAWSIDPATLLKLRLDKAENALSRGGFDMALVEAEELLDEHPAHARALQVSAQAALGMGDALTALASLTRYMELHTPDATTLVTVSAARFECVDYPGALAAGGQASTLDSSLAEAWYYQGLAAERMDHPDEARSHFTRAAELSSDRLPVPRAYADLRWEDILSKALDSLPDPVRTFLSTVPIRWDDFPAAEDLVGHYPPLSPFTDALYRGEPDPNADPWSQRPDHMHLFRANLARAVEHEEDIPEQLARALLHETAHWLGEEADPGWFANP